VRPIPAYKAGLYGLTEDRQLSESNSKPPFIPVHRTGHSGNLSKKGGEVVELIGKKIKATGMVEESEGEKTITITSYQIIEE